MKFILTLLLFQIPTLSFSQWISMPMSFQTPKGTVHYNQQIWMPMYGRPTSNSTGNPSKKYLFTIVFKSDSQVTVKTRIDISKKTHTIKVKTNKSLVTIKPTDTQEIYRVNETGYRMKGIPADSCWLFQCKTGKIIVYSFVAEWGLDYATALQKGSEGAIVPFSQKNIEEMVSDYEDALRLAKKNDLENAINTYNYRKN